VQKREGGETRERWKGDVKDFDGEGVINRKVGNSPWSEGETGARKKNQSSVPKTSDAWGGAPGEEEKKKRSNLWGVASSKEKTTKGPRREKKGGRGPKGSKNWEAELLASEAVIELGGKKRK